MGMGKLGGGELNFTSDVDVIFAYETDDGSAGDISLHEYFCKLARRVTASLGDVTEDDCVFRVDLRLRPEGSRGTIANSLPSLERYYESFGRPWERQAWLKARPCAGSIALGDEILAMLRPFIYPRTTSPRVIDEVRSLNDRIKSELDRTGIESGFDVKNGVGGIREVEFFVQALQLVHSGHRPEIRSNSTVKALDQLLFSGLVADVEARALNDGYRFLRHIEHMLQLDSGRQTQRLPDDAESLDLLARRLGHDGKNEFVALLTEHTDSIGRIFATLSEEDAEPPSTVQLLLDNALDEHGELHLLANLGFSEPDDAYRNLERARETPASPLAGSARGAAARVAPLLLLEILSSPDPDQALWFTSELISKRGSWSFVWRLMDQNQELLRLVVSLFGTSEYLSKLFVNHPDLADTLFGADRARPRRSKEQLNAELELRLSNIPIDDEEARWSTLAEFKNSQVLRIALADISGELDVQEVSLELTLIADVCLELALGWVSEAMRERHGTPRAADGEESQLGILALGKLGGRELGYASDLDVVFVYSADGNSDGAHSLDNVTYMTRLAQRLMGALHAYHPGGRLYEVDTRLRPSGSRGLLVSSVAAWIKYHQESAHIWERQALTKLRLVAGAKAVGNKVTNLSAGYTYRENPEQRTIASAVHHMREKIEGELAQSHIAQDVKVGRGGLVDIEFAAQFLQLIHGGAHPELRELSTLDALAQASDLNLADNEDCALLIEGYRFMRHLEHRMRIVHDRPIHRLPTDPAEMEKLARRVGQPDGPSLVRAFQRWTADIRDAYQRILDVD
jgi:glutamate-ammonia-ligase adenylyltransferase